MYRSTDPKLDYEGSLEVLTRYETIRAAGQLAASERDRGCGRRRPGPSAASAARGYVRYYSTLGGSQGMH